MNPSHPESVFKSSKIRARHPPLVNGSTMLQLQLLLLLLLMYIHASMQDSKNTNKLWLNDKQQTARPNHNHHQYLYLINDTQSTTSTDQHNYTLNRKQTFNDNHDDDDGGDDDAGGHWQPEDALEPSESRLSLSSLTANSSSNSSKVSASGRSKQQDKKSGKSSKTKASSKPTSVHSKSKSKPGKFIKNPSKLSISSLLSKSKRQDMLPDPKARKPRTGRHLAHGHPNSKTGVPSQSRSFHLGQPFVPYATGSHHLLFGTPLTLPDFYGGHFAAHPASTEMMADGAAAPLPPPPPPASPTSTIRHLNAQFQTQQTMPQPFHQSVAPLAEFRPAGDHLAPTIFFPAPAPLTKPNVQAHTTNSTSKTSSNSSRHQQHKTKESTGGSSSSNSTSHHPLSLPLGAAAAALFSERAKSFINHLNRGALVGLNRKKENSKETKTNTPEQTKSSQPASTSGSTLMKPMAHDNVGLASMMKNAADGWAGASTSSEAVPSILVEHDGPTITTVNFDQGAVPHHQRHTYDDDDDVNSYYESNEEEESEVGGSHDARRVVRYRVPAHQHQQPPLHHQTLHHSPYLGAHPLGLLRHVTQPRHVPYPPRYPHSRYPFEQQVQSHTIHTEVPFDPFASAYGGGTTSTMDSDYGDITRKKSYVGGGGEFPQGALQDYLRQQRVVDQPQIYPDSINAIKEQNNGDLTTDKLADLTSNIGSKLSASNSDQIDLLIKELQELNKIKRNQSSESSSSSSNGNHRKVKLLDIDYDDTSGTAGGGGGGGGGDDDEEEKLKLLRKKLLNRLRGKTRGGRRGNNNAEDSFHGEAIKIPLHTLLLAALDRRMSPSEAHSQSVVSTTGETGGGPDTGGAGEHQNKWLDSSFSSGSLVNSLALGRQQDFNEISSGLGSLLTTVGDTGPGYTEAGSSSQFTTSSDEGSGGPVSRARFGHEFNRSPQLNQSVDHLSEYKGHAPAHTPSMFILNNIRLPDQLSIEKGTNESALKSTIESSLELIRKAQNESLQEEQLFSTPTTRVPVTKDGGESTAGKKRRQVQQHQQQHQKQQQQQEDYDRGKQVEEFTRDVRTDHLGIAPDWAARKSAKLEASKRAQQDASSPSSVHFDDDSEESANRASHPKPANGKRRRKLAASSQAEATVMNSDDAADFLNKVQMDTEMEPGTNVEDPIGLASQEELNKREEKAVVEGLLNDSNNSLSSSSDADDNELELEAAHKVRPAEKDEDEMAAALWKPQIIDDEVSRLERLSTRRRRAGGNKANLDNYSAGVDDNQSFEEADTGLDIGKSGLDLADTVMKVTIDSKDGSGARITQHFSGSKPTRSPSRLSNRRLVDGKKS